MNLTPDEEGVVRILENGGVIVSPVDFNIQKKFYLKSTYQYKELVPLRTINKLVELNIIKVTRKPGKSCEWDIYELVTLTPNIKIYGGTMNKNDLELIRRLYFIIDSVPRAASGAHSTTSAGLVAYSEDMRKFMPMVKSLLLSILEESNGFRGDELTWGASINLMDELESWVDQRKSEYWK